MLWKSDPAILVTGATGFYRQACGYPPFACRPARDDLGPAPRRYLVNDTERLVNRSPLEMRVARMLSPYRDYLQQDVQFDVSTARRLLGRHRVEPPVIDDRELDRFFELAWFSDQNGPPCL